MKEYNRITKYLRLLVRKSIQTTILIFCCLLALNIDAQNEGTVNSAGQFEITSGGSVKASIWTIGPVLLFEAPEVAPIPPGFLVLGDSIGKLSDPNLSTRLTDQLESLQLTALYPVPTQNELNLEYEPIENEEIILQIYSLDGSLIMTSTLPESIGKTNKQIDVSNLQAGSYFVQLVSNSGTSKTMRFLKT